MGLEFELKYRAAAEDLAAIRAAFPGGETIAMATTYYDTPGGDLVKRHWTLRQRLENGRPVCTLKTPAGELGRGEWETESGDLHAAIPVLAELSHHSELLEWTAAGVSPTCGVRFTRIAVAIAQADFTAELALDQGVLLGGSLEQPFAEVELELKSGSREALVAYAGHFAARFGLEPQPKSKYAPARALAQEGRHGI